MKQLASAIKILLTLVVMGGIVVNRLSEMFPHMDTLAWVIAVAGFGVLILAILPLDALVEKLWPGRFKDDDRMWLETLAVFLFAGLLLYLGWDIISPLLAPYFGAAVLG